MKNLYFILTSSLILLTLNACTTAPKTKPQPVIAEESVPTEVTITTYECFADPNLAEPVTLKEKLHKGENLTGVILSCKGETVIVDTILDYGPEQVNILDVTTGRWQTYDLKDCQIASPQ